MSQFKILISNCRTGLLFISALSILFAACENDIKEVNIITQKDNYATETAKGLEIIYSDSAVVKARILTPELNRFLTVKVPYTEMPKGLKMEFFDESLQVISTLTANYAKRNEVSKLMEARGNVVIVNRRGEMLNTEELLWDEVAGEFRSNAYVKITKPDQIIYGTGLTANQDFTRYKISNISGIISVNGTE